MTQSHQNPGKAGGDFTDGGTAATSRQETAQRFSQRICLRLLARHNDRPAADARQSFRFRASRDEDERRVVGQFCQIDVRQVSPFLFDRPVDRPLVARIVGARFLKERPIPFIERLPQRVVAVPHRLDAEPFQPVAANAYAVRFKIPAATMRTEDAQPRQVV